ncbi:hypothetical protein D9757_008946 [Collybiopsis confluens]|uniref:ornithine decarboxylase n=1 Tax=Collybiopsis confluens TaxID=2823264 RepID=A0A8H5HEU9_9AGAR|nr:hypothetical protein D9757_008946 [Collybiopsis confluens]
MHTGKVSEYIKTRKPIKDHRTTMILYQVLASLQGAVVKSLQQTLSWVAFPMTIEPTNLPPVLRGDSVMHMQHEIAKSFSVGAEHGSFFVADLSSVVQQHRRWKHFLPEIRPFYAIKCNPDPVVLHLLAGLGACFDCASLAEINMALAALGPSYRATDPSTQGQRIIFASPCKFSSDIRGAARLGIMMSTFDNMDELDKIAQHYPASRLVLRILADDSRSHWPLSRKYGAHLAVVPSLLKRAKELGLDVIGVSFHAGSGCSDPTIFADSVARARKAFDIGKELGYKFTLLDIGGGFEDKLMPDSDVNLFEENARVLKGAIAEYFPVADRPKEFEVIGEPGRFYATNAFTLVTNIIARRAVIPGVNFVQPNIPVPGKEGAAVAELMLYLSDGTYGGLNNVLLDRKIAIPFVIAKDQSFSVPDEEKEPASIWGPTLDSIDCVNPWAMVPRGLGVGDWLGFKNMGAYTLCGVTKFNGFDASRVLYTTGAQEDGEQAWKILGKNCGMSLE